MGCYDFCNRKSKILSIVNGEEITITKHCNTEREDGFIGALIFKTCGKSGRFFEQKK